LFEQCPEYTIKDKNSRRCDPLLCLFDGCHVMGTENEDVENRITNGTPCIFKKAYLKHGATLQPIELNGYWVIQFRLKMLNFWNWNGKTLRALLVDFELKRKPGHVRLTFPWRKMD
jgi:hypothetical protein